MTYVSQTWDDRDHGLQWEDAPSPWEMSKGEEAEIGPYEGLICISNQKMLGSYDSFDLESLTRPFSVTGEGQR